MNSNECERIFLWNPYEDIFGRNLLHYMNFDRKSYKPIDCYLRLTYNNYEWDRAIYTTTSISYMARRASINFVIFNLFGLVFWFQSYLFPSGKFKTAYSQAIFLNVLLKTHANKKILNNFDDSAQLDLACYWFLYSLSF